MQRRLRLGYTRAARIMDELELRGIVGPNKGAEPRDILIDLDGGGADGNPPPGQVTKELLLEFRRGGSGRRIGGGGSGAGRCRNRFPWPRS